MSIKNKRKFYTTLTDHDQGRVLYGIPKSHKVAAADPAWLARWIKANGPYLFHSTSQNAKEKIMQEGLIPHDQGPGSMYNRDLVPRANHSYVQTYGGHMTPPLTVAIDLRKLNPQHLNPDEDSLSEEKVARAKGLPAPIQAPDRYTPWGYAINESTGNEDHELPYWIAARDDPPGPERRLWHHCGHWADDLNLVHPELTAHSLNYTGTLAVEGGVPADALTDMLEARDYMYQHHADQFTDNSYGPMRRYHPIKVPYELPQEGEQAA